MVLLEWQDKKKTQHLWIPSLQLCGRCPSTTKPTIFLKNILSGWLDSISNKLTKLGSTPAYARSIEVF